MTASVESASFRTTTRPHKRAPPAWREPFLAKLADYKQIDKVCAVLVEYWFKHNHTVNGGI